VLDGTANTQVLVVIVAAAAFSCLVGWLLEGGFALRRSRRDETGSGAMRATPERTREFGDEFVRAFALAIKSHVDFAADDQAVIDAIVRQLGWSPTRARWFVTVNREQVQQAARQMQGEERGSISACGK
jgi:hypothetical protein